MLSEQIVIEVVAQLLDVDEASLTPDSRLADIESWDSVNALRVMVYLERELGVPVNFAHFIAATCLGDLWRRADAAPAVAAS
jgi:acyl carrier protein